MDSGLRYFLLLNKLHVGLGEGSEFRIDHLFWSRGLVSQLVFKVRDFFRVSCLVGLNSIFGDLDVLIEEYILHAGMEGAKPLASSKRRTSTVLRKSARPCT